MARISKSQLEKLRKKYKTDDSIGKLFGISRQAIHQLRIRYGIDPVKNKNSDRNSDIIKQYNQGATGTKIAKKYRLSISQTYRIITETKGKVKKAAKTKR